MIESNAAETAVRRWGGWLRNEITGWTAWGYAWIAFCVAVTVGLSLGLGDHTLGIVSALTGVLYTLLAGKGKISCYLFGIVNTAAYGWISFQQTLYGEVMLNWGWYLPMMFVGLFCWKRHLGTRQVIIKTRLSTAGRLIMTGASAAGIAGYALLLHRLGDQAPVIDSLTTILSVTAMILTVKRCIEQWVLWTIVNLFSIYMWLRIYLDGAESAATLFMWVLALANGIIFFIQWQKETAPCPNAK